MSMKWEELQKVSDDDLIKEYDETAAHTCVGLNYYTAEIMRRSNERANKAMVKYTKLMTIMTAIILIWTIVTVEVAIIK